MQIVWLNGCFGSGKTVTARALVAADPSRLLFDPELLGYLLWETDPSLRGRDFRELRVWRRLVVESAVALVAEHGRPLVVPMSLFSPEHLSVVEELRGRDVQVDHVVLLVSEAELRRRIAAQRKAGDDDTDAGTRAFRLDELPAGLAMTADPPPGARVIETAGLTTDQVAALLA